MDNKFYIERELEARVRAEKAARDLLDRAAEENRDLSPEEDEQFNRLIAESDRRKARAQALGNIEFDAEVRAVTSAAAAVETAPKSWDEQAVETLRSVFHDNTSGEIALPQLTLGKVPYGEVRALESTANVNVPTDFSTRVALYQRTVSPWVGLSTVINGTDGAPIYLPRITTDPTTYTPGQGTAITPSDPVLTSTSATPAAYKALTYISQEMAEDDVISIMDYIARSQGRSIGLSFGSATTTAVLAAATNGGTASGTPFFTLNDLIDLVYARAVPYRVAGSFVMANGAISKARKFVDSNGQYLWQPSVQAGQPDRLLGYAVYEDPYLATPASATKSVLFGDMSAWVIKQLPLRTAISTEVKFAEDQVGFKSVYRAGGALPDTAAIAYLVSANS